MPGVNATKQIGQAPTSRSGRRRTVMALTGAALALCVTPALAAPVAPATLPVGDPCVTAAAGTVRDTFPNALDRNGHRITVRLLCGTQAGYGLRHIDDGHAPNPGTLDVASVIACIRNATARTPVTSGHNWLYTRTTVFGTWSVVTDPAGTSVVTAYKNGSGNQRAPFSPCV